MPDAVRVLVLGDAHVHTADHLAVLRADPHCELVGVVPEREVHDCSTGGADVVVVCSTTAAHPDAVGRALDGGAALFVEKPLATTAAGTRALAARIEVAGVPFATGMFLRCVPALRRLRELLRAGELGEPSSVHLRFTHPGLLDGVFRGDAAWHLSPEDGGTGAFADLGVHLLDLLRWLRPDADLTARSCLPVHRGERVDVGGVAILDWSGVPVTLHAGWTGRPGGLFVQVEGTAATADVVDGTITVRAPGSSSATGDAPPSAGSALAAFLSERRGVPAWDAPTPDDTVAAAEALDALAAIAVLPGDR